MDLVEPAPTVVPAAAGATEETVGVLAGKGRGKEGTSMDGRSAQVHL